MMRGFSSGRSAWEQIANLVILHKVISKLTNNEHFLGLDERVK